MRKREKMILAVLCIPVFLLSGCSRLFHYDPSDPNCRVVTGIEVHFENGPIKLHRLYTASEKMQQILNYFRLIDPYGAPDEDPETAEGSSFRITLSYSDGCEKTYLQKSDRFLMTDGQPWRKIDPKRAQELSQIIGTLESDAA